MGGLACHLDFGFSDAKAVHIVSITHLKFDRKNPLARETEAFCTHRIKRLEKLVGGMASTGAFGRSSRQWHVYVAVRKQSTEAVGLVFAAGGVKLCQL